MWGGGVGVGAEGLFVVVVVTTTSSSNYNSSNSKNNNSSNSKNNNSSSKRTALATTIFHVRSNMSVRNKRGLVVTSSSCCQSRGRYFDFLDDEKEGFLTQDGHMLPARASDWRELEMVSVGPVGCCGSSGWRLWQSSQSSSYPWKPQ